MITLTIMTIGVILNLIIAIFITKYEIYDNGRDFTLSSLITALLLCLIPYILLIILVGTRAVDPVILKGKKK